MDHFDTYHNHNHNHNHNPTDPQRPLNARNPKGLTPLLIACERNLPSVVEEFVLRRNADTDVCDERGMSPLAVAAFCGCEDVVRTLLSLMSTTSTMEDAKGVILDSKTATETATGADDNGVDTTTNNNTKKKVLGRDMLDRVDNQGCTPLWHAARTGNAKMVEILIHAGADGTRKDDTNGLTPQEAAVKFKKDKVVDFFRSIVKA